MAASPSVVLHLGAHKTGTSLLQKYMGQRREMARMRLALLSRDVTDELMGWGQAPVDHLERLREAVLAAGRRRLPIAGVFRLPQALSVIAGALPSTVIVSHENALGRPFGRRQHSLYPAAGEGANGLARSLGDLPLRVVYYLRSQEQFLESYYLQTVQQGGTATFDAWLSRIDLAAVSWVPVVEALTGAFGADRVVVRDFSELARGQNAFIRGFLQACDPRLNPEVDFQALANISISQQGLDLALAMNPLLQTSSERRDARLFLQQHFNNTTGPRPVLLSDDAKLALRDRYEVENRELIARHRGLGGPAGGGAKL